MCEAYHTSDKEKSEVLLSSIARDGSTKSMVLLVQPSLLPTKSADEYQSGVIDETKCQQ